MPLGVDPALDNAVVDVDDEVAGAVELDDAGVVVVFVVDDVDARVGVIAAGVVPADVVVLVLVLVAGVVVVLDAVGS